MSQNKENEFDKRLNQSISLLENIIQNIKDDSVSKLLTIGAAEFAFNIIQGIEKHFDDEGSLKMTSEKWSAILAHTHLLGFEAYALDDDENQEADDEEKEESAINAALRNKLLKEFEVNNG